MSDADVVLGRLSTFFGTKNDRELSKALGVSPSTLSNWRNRNTVPYKACMDVSERLGVSLDWLLMGKESETENTQIVNFSDTTRLFLQQLQMQFDDIQKRLEKLENERKER